MCILLLGENGLEKYRLSKNWERFKIVLLFMDHPVYWVPPGPTQEMELMGPGGEGPSRSTPVSPAMPGVMKRGVSCAIHNTNLS